MCHNEYAYICVVFVLCIKCLDDTRKVGRYPLTRRQLFNVLCVHICCGVLVNRFYANVCRQCVICAIAMYVHT